MKPAYVCVLGLVLLLSTLSHVAMANDLEVVFLVKDCTGNAMQGVTINLKDCVDGAGLLGTTNSSGLVGFYKFSPEQPQANNQRDIQYCWGSARNLCSWTLTLPGSNTPLDASSITGLSTRTVDGTPSGADVTPMQFACGCPNKDPCGCSDACLKDPRYPTIILTLSNYNCPCSCPTCPSECVVSVPVWSGKQGSGMRVKTVSGVCSGPAMSGKHDDDKHEDDHDDDNIMRMPKSQDKKYACPRGYKATRVPCPKIGATLAKTSTTDDSDCGVCCIPHDSLCKRKDADSKDKWSCSSSCDSSPADKLKIKASCDDSTCKGHGLMHGVGLQCCPSKK